MDVPRYSASPPCSFASSVQPVRRVASFSETVGAVMRWMTGRRRPASPRERQIEAKIVERLAAEIEEECACLQVVDNARPPVGDKPKVAKSRTP